jgi:NADH dehydrogenase/NADH:ubiquinone oxidoreductase subunit G
MKILLLNTNPVVSRLVSLCMRDTSIHFEEVGYSDEISDNTYDIVFVDDASYTKELAAFLDSGRIGKVVFFSGRDAGDEIGTGIDTVIKKPFLPSQIQQIIDQVASEEVPSAEKEGLMDSEEKTEHFLFPLSGDKSVFSEIETSDKEDVLPEPKVLDSREIEQIKALLDDEDDMEQDIPEDEAEYEARKIEVITKKLEADGLEIVQEEDILPILSQEQKKKNRKRKKVKKNKVTKKAKKKKEEEIYTIEEALLAAIENMKPKKIKKLLKDAEITIKIRFKEEM